jgi:hypothetical protein
MARIIAECTLKTRALLKEKEGLIQALATKLLEKENLNSREI